MGTRIRLDALNLSLKGYAPAEADRLVRALPDALARRVARPDAPVRPDDLAGRVAREVVGEIRRRAEREG